MTLLDAVRVGATALPPAFSFGHGEETLALMGGGLILDSGEAENTFPFRCQERFVVYTSLLGVRSVMLTLDDQHESQLRALIDSMSGRLRDLTRLQGLPLPAIPAPLFVRCGITELCLLENMSFDLQARALAEQGRSVGFIANQASPTTTRLLRQLAELLRTRGVEVPFDSATCERVGALALQWHNKARLLELRTHLQNRCGLPWVDSTVIAPADLLTRPQWAHLVHLATRGWSTPATLVDEIFLKSAQDSSGNVTTIVSRDGDSVVNADFLADVRRWLLVEDFASPTHLAELFVECKLSPSLADVHFDDTLLAALRRGQASRRGGIPIIAQPVIRPPPGSTGLPASVGVSVVVGDGGAASLMAVNAQLYRDADRRRFVGTLLDNRLNERVEVAHFARECIAAASQLAEFGWRGPMNFDGCLGPDGRYWFTGDCNPRLTALYVPLAVRTWLMTSGIEARSVASFGYRGEATPDEAALAAWTSAGLLFGADEDRGMLILPNLARRNGHDLIAINLDIEEAGDQLRRMRALAPDAVPQHLECIHA